MTIDGLCEPSTVAAHRQHGNSSQKKARQAAKIRELRDALMAAGFVTLDEQAAVLGLSRSTTWSVLKGTHKSSGLSVVIINRMLEAPTLPSAVIRALSEYAREKAMGLYGHNLAQRRRFLARLSAGPDLLDPPPAQTRADSTIGLRSRS